MSSAGFPSKSGGVNLEDYTTISMITEFEPISQALQSEFDQERSNPVLQPALISELVASVINFQEKYCGINANRPPFTRFPYHIFRDYKAHGHLHRLLRIMVSHCASQAWYKTTYQINSEGIHHRLLLDLNNEALLHQYFAMFTYIETQLRKQKVITAKVVYFSPLISAHSRTKLALIARNHGAAISANNDSNVTHVILPNNADMEDSSDEHVRTVDKQDKLAYIHYWFYPSSYDQWISDELIDGEAEHIDPPPGAWQVGERFITDLEKFNEWMVELDYEVLDSTPEPQHHTQAITPVKHTHMQPITQTQVYSQPQSFSSNNGYGNNSHSALNTLADTATALAQSTHSRKRKRDRNNAAIIDDTEALDDGEWVPPTKRPKYSGNVIDLIDDSENEPPMKSTHMLSAQSKKKNIKLKLKRRKNPSTHTATLESIKQEISHKKRGTNPVLSGADMFPYCGPSLTRIRPMIASYPIVIPSYARWFRLDRIHPIEYQGLHSLFRNKAMQYHERYMQIRNFICNSYRVNPRVYLTVTACRRMIAGDAGMVMRIHKFLEQWGLINYKCDDGTMPEYEPPIMDYTHIDTPFGIKIALKPSGEQTAQTDLKSSKAKKIKQQNREFMLRENIFAMAEKQSQSQLHTTNANTDTIVCSFCSIDCSGARYRCTVQPDVILCSKCFDEKKYCMVFTDDDFEMELEPIKPKQHNSNSEQSMDIDNDDLKEDKSFTIQPWTDSEIKKLRNALCLYHDNWSKVAEHMGRDEQECIAQFIQLPIKDAFLDGIEQNRDGDISKIYHPQISNYIATSISHSNPIEHMLSFLNPNPTDTPSPFNDVSHPILAQAASLSAMVNSELVNVASGAALQFVCKQKVIEAKDLKVNLIVDTKMGRGVIQEICDGMSAHNIDNFNRNVKSNINDCEYVIKYEWGEARLKFEGIIDIVRGREGIEGGEGKSWEAYPQNVSESKAKAAGILGASAVIAKALKSRKDSHIEQLMQHLVLLQSQKVKAKMAHLEQLWDVLRGEREEIEEMRQELFRERIEIAQIKMDLQDGDLEDIDVEEERGKS